LGKTDAVKHRKNRNGLLLIPSGRKTWRKEQLERKEGQDFWQWEVTEHICNVKVKSQREGPSLGLGESHSLLLSQG